MAGTPDALTLRVAGFVPAERPGQRIAGMPFSRDKSPLEKHARVKVRLTVDGRSREFWLPAGLDAADPQMSDPQMAEPRLADQHGAEGVGETAAGETVAGRGRRVTVACTADVVNLGFGVFLQEFQRKLDPGTSEASHYASLVNLWPWTPTAGNPARSGCATRC